ncbi:hypothetical protein [Sphingomonas sp. IC081]|uniref:hypothetical protein n=1 Tax=Sphingomonas sp. IC081 TaxID=304378 RepID=UPI001158D761|nr:hypothetical protein [Sphingomonas sp. IC081]QDK34120.1 hypothetical protein DM450_15330 [Sphingomonas sp. IC081]
MLQVNSERARGYMEGQPAEKRLTAWQGLFAVVLGTAVAVIVGQFATVGAAEIAGVMVASITICVTGFRDYRSRKWFAPLMMGWITLHLAALIFVVIPMKIAGSKFLIQLIWPDYLAFVALVFLAERVWERRSQR